MNSERSALMTSIVACLFIGSVGIVFAALTRAEAILLDGLFNVTYFITGIFTLKVSRLVIRRDDNRFPYGYGFFEPLVNGIKGVLMLGVSLMALAGSVAALFGGGREIEMGGAVVYGLIATTVAWIVAGVMHRATKKVDSPLVDTDAANWIVNAAISSAVLITFAAVFALERAGVTGIVPYIDPIVVTVVVLISIGVPIRMARKALLALLNHAPAHDIVESSRETVTSILKDVSASDVAVRVIQPGRVRMVSAHVLFAAGKTPPMPTLDGVRERVQEALVKLNADTAVDLIFTEDERWFAGLTATPH